MENDNNTKICNGVLCNGKVLPIDKFPYVKGKIMCICDDCINEKTRLCYLKNKEKGREYYLLNKNRIKENQKKYVDNNKDKIQKQQQNNYQNNKAKIQERHQKHRQANKKMIHDKAQIQLQIEDVYIQHLISTLRVKDAKKKREFNIDFEYFKELQKGQDNKCKYSGKELVWKNKHGIYQGTIDRIDSSKGHIKGNCQLVSVQVNRFKLDLSHSDFLKLIDTMKNKKCEEQYIIEELDNTQKKKIRDLYHTMRGRQRNFNVIKYKEIMKNAEFTDDEIEFFSKFYKPDSYIDFDIKYLQELCKNNNICAISGIKISWTSNDLFVGSFDRIDSSKVYSKNNIQVTSLYINYLKNVLTTDETITLLNEIIEHYGKTNLLIV